MPLDLTFRCPNSVFAKLLGCTVDRGLGMCTMPRHTRCALPQRPPPHDAPDPARFILHLSLHPRPFPSALLADRLRGSPQTGKTPPTEPCAARKPCARRMHFSTCSGKPPTSRNHTDSTGVWQKLFSCLHHSSTTLTLQRRGTRTRCIGTSRGLPWGLADEAWSHTPATEPEKGVRLARPAAPCNSRKGVGGSRLFCGRLAEYQQSAPG